MNKKLKEKYENGLISIRDVLHEADKLLYDKKQHSKAIRLYQFLIDGCCGSSVEKWCLYGIAEAYKALGKYKISTEYYSLLTRIIYKW